jgi:hypothetical protein
LHDIQARTVAALPAILRELKNRGFHVVHVVPATAERPKTPTEPREWRLHPTDTPVAIKWPAAPEFVFAQQAATEVPDLADTGAMDDSGKMIAAATIARSVARSRIPLPLPAPWPRLAGMTTGTMGGQLPAPAEQLFRSGLAPVDLKAGIVLMHRADARPSPTDLSSAEREAMNSPARVATP